MIKQHITCNLSNRIFGIKSLSAVPSLVPEIDIRYRIISSPRELGIYQNEKSLEKDWFKLISFLRRGASIYLAFSGSEIAGYYCVTKLGRFSPFVFTRHPVFSAPNTYYIFFCTTVDRYRNNGIYPYMLTRICRDILRTGRRALISTGRDHHSSLKGIKNAGFHEIADITYRQIGPMIITCDSTVLSH